MKAIRLVSLILKREGLLSYRQPAQWCYPICFFVLVVTLFPLAMRVDDSLFRAIGPSVIWVGVLLANSLSLPRLFGEDWQDGTLAQFILSEHPLGLLVFSKVLAHWLLLFLPLTLIAPCLALMFHLSLHATWVLLLSLLLGTPTLSLWGAMIAALTTGLRQGTLLMLFIVLPLYTPVLIFASQAVLLAQQGLSVAGPFAMLGAFLALALAIMPFVGAFALRISIAY